MAATHAMVKAANLQIVKRIDIGGGLVTAIVSGDVSNIRAVVEPGALVASLPREVNWMVMLGGGTLAGSAISAIMGCALLLMFMPKESHATASADD